MFANAQQVTPANDTIYSVSAYLKTFAVEHSLDTWDWLALIIAGISLLVAIGMAIWQYKTERNTMKITKAGQIGLLIDYVRHFYANFVITLAIKTKLNGRFRKLYPSEEHFMKLAVDLDALHPEAFVRNKTKYQAVHNLLLLVRNYNIEIEVAMKHICDRHVSEEAKKRDFDTLTFKPGHIAKSVAACIKALHPGKNYTQKIRQAIIDAAITRTKFDDEITKISDDKERRDRQLAIIRERAKDMPRYYGNTNSLFIKSFFPNDPDLFLDLLNVNVHTEIHEWNNEDSPKTLLIPFGRR